VSAVADVDDAVDDENLRKNLLEDDFLEGSFRVEQ